MNQKRSIVSGVLMVLLLGGLLLQGGSSIAQEKVPVTFWHAMGGWRIEVIERMAADFNLQHPWIEVKPDFKGGYRDTLLASIEAAKKGTPVHVTQIFEVGTRMALDSGVYAAAEDLIEMCGAKVNWDWYLDAAMEYYTINGKHYSFPWNSSNPILYYNKNIFEKAGVSLPKEPTYSDVYQAAKKIVEGGYAEYGITWPVHSWFVEQWMAEQDQNLVNNDNGLAGRPSESYLTSDAAKRIFRWWGQLYKEGLYAPTGFEAWGEAKRIFLGQKAAMLIYSTSDVAALGYDAAEAGFEVGTTFLPVPDEVPRTGVIIGGGSLWIAKDLPKEEACAAVDFVLWMSSVAQTIRWHQNTGYFPIKKVAVEVLEEEGWFERFPNFRTAFDQLIETKITSATKGAKMGAFLEVRTCIGNAYFRMKELIDGGTPVDQAVDTALNEAKSCADKAICDYREAIGEPCP